WLVSPGHGGPFVLFLRTRARGQGASTRTLCGHTARTPGGLTMKTNVARILLTAALVTGLSIPVASAASARTASAAAGRGQGPLLAWGDNSLGELGIGSMQNQYSPVAVNMPFGLRATQARSGPFSIAVNPAGQVFAWGRGEQGELGNGAF